MRAKIDFSVKPAAVDSTSFYVYRITLWNFHQICRDFTENPSANICEESVAKHMPKLL